MTTLIARSRPVRTVLPAVVPAAFAVVAAAFAQPTLAQQEVILNFAAEVGGSPFACGEQYSGMGTTAATITPTDFRLYLSALALLDADGKAVPLTLEQDGIWQYQDVALLDFEDGSGPCQNGNTPTNLSIRGTVPAADYKGVQFTLGLPFELNHADNLLAASPLNLSAMFWNWQGGYRFFKVDITAAGSSDMAAGMHMGQGMRMGQGMHMGGQGMGGRMQQNAAAQTEAAGHGNGGFLVHLGSTGCASDSTTTAPLAACANPNRVEVVFADFDAAADTIVIDLAGVLQYSDLNFNTPETAPGCMSGISDPECAGIFKGFGLDGSPQQLFSVKQ
jgi:uncharacterized repeat protein (TIGR04052 family)